MKYVLIIWPRLMTPEDFRNDLGNYGLRFGCLDLHKIWKTRMSWPSMAPTPSIVTPIRNKGFIAGVISLGQAGG